MNHSKVIRPTSFPSPLKRRLNSNPPPFSNLKSSDLLRSSHAKLQPLPTFKPQNRSATLCHKPAHFLVPKPCSPSDSGVSSISSHDSNDRTPLTPSGIMPIHDIWSNGKFGSGEFDPAGQTISNHFGSFDEYSSTAGGEHRFLSETDRLVAEIWNAPADQSIKSSFSSLSNSNRSNKPAVAAGRSLLTNLSKLNDLNAAYEFDSKAPVGVDGVDLGATIMNTKQLGAPIEQCEDDCNACWSPNSRKTLADARNSLINEQQLVDDCRRCTDLSHFDRLLDLAEVIYQANYDDVTYSEYRLFELCSSSLSVCLLANSD